MEGEKRVPPAEMVPKEKIEAYGIGHLKEDQNHFDIQAIPEQDREGLLEDYQEALKGIESMLAAVSKMIDMLQVPEHRRSPLDNIVTGLDEALHRTVNQLLMHGSVDAQESSDAFDEFVMLTSIISEQIEHPEIESKKVVNENTIYELKREYDEVKHRTIQSAQALFSHRNVAWNIVSTSPYTQKHPSKSGIRLDWGPLYAEDDAGVIDKAKTQWRVSFDISGREIDKVMNKYSLRGHHFPDVFDYKIGLLVAGLSDAMKGYYDEHLSAS